jgi:hypothetical protein
MGGHFVMSKDNIAAGFELDQPSSSQAMGGGLEVEFGGGLTSRMVLSGYLRMASFTRIRTRVEGVSIALRGISYRQIALGASACYFFERDWYIGTRLGIMSQRMASGPLLDDTIPPGFHDADVVGPALGMSGGKTWHLFSEVWLGLDTRLDFAALGQDLRSIRTWVLMPQVAAQFMWF